MNIWKILAVFTVITFLGLGCTKKQVPKKSQIVDETKTFCEIYPESDLCKTIAGMSPFELSEVKPLYLHIPTRAIIAWSDPAWNKPMPYMAGKETTATSFAVEEGSILKAGDTFSHIMYSYNGRMVIPTSEHRVAAEASNPGWNVTISATFAGSRIIHIAVFKDHGKYLVLPSIELMPSNR